MTKKRLDAAAILRTLAEIRNAMPRPAGPPAAPPAARYDGRTTGPAGSWEDFELLAVKDALDSLEEELSAELKERERQMFEQALDVYYAAEDLTRDGQHPEIVPHLEAMRTAYQTSYGLPVPPREKRAGAYAEMLKARR